MEGGVDALELVLEAAAPIAHRRHAGDGLQETLVGRQVVHGRGPEPVLDVVPPGRALAAQRRPGADGDELPLVATAGDARRRAAWCPGGTGAVVRSDHTQVEVEKDSLVGKVLEWRE